MMSGNVIDVLKTLGPGVTIWGNSNNPTNQPSGMGYGSYTVFKSSAGLCTIIVAQKSQNKIAIANGVNPDSDTSINWMIFSEDS